MSFPPLKPGHGPQPRWAPSGTKPAALDLWWPPALEPPKPQGASKPQSWMGFMENPSTKWMKSDEIW